MTFAPMPTDPKDLYAMMGAEALLAHLDAVVSALDGVGVEITPAARHGLDEIAECVVEHHARHDPAALRHHLAKVQGELAVSKTRFQHDAGAA